MHNAKFTLRVIRALRGLRAIRVLRVICALRAIRVIRGPVCVSLPKGRAGVGLLGGLRDFTA